MSPYTITVLVFIFFFLAGGATLNYASTGSVWKILPDRKLWFWGNALGMATFASLLIGMIVFLSGAS